MRTIKDLEEWDSPYESMTLCELYEKRVGFLDAVVKAGGWAHVPEDVDNQHFGVFLTIIKREATQQHAEALSLDRLRDTSELEYPQLEG